MRIPKQAGEREREATFQEIEGARFARRATPFGDEVAVRTGRPGEADSDYDYRWLVISHDGNTTYRSHDLDMIAQDFVIVEIKPSEEAE